MDQVHVFLFPIDRQRSLFVLISTLLIPLPYLPGTILPLSNIFCFCGLRSPKGFVIWKCSHPSLLPDQSPQIRCEQNDRVCFIFRFHSILFVIKLLRGKEFPDKSNCFLQSCTIFQVAHILCYTKHFVLSTSEFVNIVPR